jgi:hypothetical protein
MTLSALIYTDGERLAVPDDELAARDLELPCSDGRLEPVGIDIRFLMVFTATNISCSPNTAWVPYRL